MKTHVFCFSFSRRNSWPLVTNIASSSEQLEDEEDEEQSGSFLQPILEEEEEHDNEQTMQGINTVIF